MKAKLILLALGLALLAQTMPAQAQEGGSRYYPVPYVPRKLKPGWERIHCGYKYTRPNGRTDLICDYGCHVAPSQNRCESDGY